MIKYIVYKTTNLLNSKIYIGAHACSGKRNCTKDGMCKYLGSGIAISRAIDLHGCDNFYRETLKEFQSSEDMYEYEATIVDQAFINRPDTYNACLGGYGGVGGLPKSVEHRKKLSDAKKGRKLTEQQKKKIGDSNRGKVVSKETCKKMTEAKLGHSVSSETRLKLREANIGIKQSPETISKRIATMKLLPILHCPHCGKEGRNPGAMKMWHFNNCKLV